MEVIKINSFVRFSVAYSPTLHTMSQGATSQQALPWTTLATALPTTSNNEISPLSQHSKILFFGMGIKMAIMHTLSAS